MYKTNKYNGKKYKKKKVYSPIKDPYIVSNELAKKDNVSGIEIFMEMLGLNENPWMIFYKDVLKGDCFSFQPPQFRLENIIYLTQDEGMQKRIYSELMDIPGYNPLIHKVPTNFLTQNLKTYIRKLQTEIILNEKYTKKNLFILENDIFNIPCTLSTDKRFQKINFKNGYGILLYLGYNKITITPNFNLITEDKKYRIQLNKVFDTIIHSFPDSQLTKNKEIVINFTNFSTETINEIIEIIQNNIEIIEKKKEN